MGPATTPPESTTQLKLSVALFGGIIARAWAETHLPRPDGTWCHQVYLLSAHHTHNILFICILE